MVPYKGVYDPGLVEELEKTKVVFITKKQSRGHALFIIY